MGLFNFVSITEKNEQLQILTDLIVSITNKVGHQSLLSVLSKFRQEIDAPFTFVIVGEVKAGKSSFINALLAQGKEICKVAPMPMTDTIQQLLYGSEDKIEAINPYLKKIYQPVEILKEITIVDTPGTNTIIDHHQEITENFIPHADLIVFVFEAKNPYRQSSWAFFDYISEEWHRKMIFILQQKDLLPLEDLLVNVNGVIDQAKQKGIAMPQVFAVSAKLEQDGYHDISGFKELRSFLEKNILGGRAPELKLQNNVNTLLTIADKLDASMIMRIKQYQADQKFRKEIQTLIDEQHQKTNRNINMLVESLVDSYSNITHQKYDDLEQGLSFANVVKRSFSSIFGKETGLKEWLNNQAKDFELKLNSQLKSKLQNGITDVAENIQTMGKLVDNKLRYSETILQNSDEIFADIAERRINVLKDLQDSFAEFMNTSENFYADDVLSQSSKMTPNLATGSGIAIVGVILASVTQGAVFDVTGGVLTTVGVLFAGVSLGLNRSKILNKFHREIQIGKDKMHEEVNSKLQDYAKRIKYKIEENFFKLDEMLRIEGQIISEVETALIEVREKLKRLA